MKLKNTSVCLLAGWMLMACSGGGYEKTSNGIIVNVEQQQPTDVRKVKVEVMGEKLIHVSATPEKNFSKAESLIIVPKKDKTDFSVEESEDAVSDKILRGVRHCIQSHGEVRFTDASGEPGFWRKMREAGVSSLLKCREQRRIRYVRYSSHPMMRHSTDWDNTRLMNSIIKVRTRNFSSIIQRFPYLLSFPIRITVFCGIVIRFAVSAIHVIMHS